jgi:hypothetical protein
MAAIGGYWYPRGGIPIDVFWQSGPAPAGLWLPDQGVPAIAGAADRGIIPKFPDFGEGEQALPFSWA